MLDTTNPCYPIVMKISGMSLYLLRTNHPSNIAFGINIAANQAASFHSLKYALTKAIRISNGISKRLGLIINYIIIYALT